VATFVNGFNDARLTRVVLKGLAKDGNTSGQNIIGDEDVRPDGGNELFFVDDARVLGKIDKHLHGFGLDAGAVAVFGDDVDGRTDEPFAKFEIALHRTQLQDSRQ